MRFGMGVAVLSAATFGTSGPLARLLIDAGWSSVGVALVRLALAALTLVIPMAIVGRRRLATLRHAPLTVIAYGVFGVMMAQLCFFNAVRYLDVAVALLIEYAAPLLVIGYEWLVRGRRPGSLTLVGAAVAVAGLLIVIGGNGVGAIDPVGIAWACAAAVGLAGYFLLADDNPDSERPAVDPLALATGGLLVGSVIVGVIATTGLLPIEANTRDVTVHAVALPWWSAVIAIALLSTVVSYVTGIAAVRTLGVTVASFVALLEVVSSGLVSWGLLGQLLSAYQIIGGAVLLGGVIVVRWAADRSLPDSVAVAEPHGPVEPELLVLPPQTDADQSGVEQSDVEQFDLALPEVIELADTGEPVVDGPEETVGQQLLPA
ncbi:EamA family transporter [Jongsikchunia kroppenstedtii]|uniref:EamA family transporter n=1 Tax=Jongsikchunia kroppenstedtii TaxID=1121721 RepID=UPI00138B0D9B|nr:EamA family transporter [Jongsikchunia kroppenstedtii]